MNKKKLADWEKEYDLKSKVKIENIMSKIYKKDERTKYASHHQLRRS